MSDEVKAETSPARYGDLEPGRMIADRFKIISKLAEGGMGKVYVATQEPIGRQIALKVLRREFSADELAVKRFFREAVAASKLHHPNTITILDYGECEDETLFIAMELLDGENLHALLNREGSLGVHRAVRIAVQIAKSLAEAHKKGVIHRDLKPENIFISAVEGETDLVKVLDFGIAMVQHGEAATRITRAGYVCGTPEYMSPEQARADALEGTSDLYALGILLWEMLVGDVPYSAATPLGTVLQHQSQPIPVMPGAFPEQLKDFIYRAIAKDAAERPQSAEAFIRALYAVVPGVGETDVDFPPEALRAASPLATPEALRRTGSLAMASTLGAGEEPMLPAAPAQEVGDAEAAVLKALGDLTEVAVQPGPTFDTVGSLAPGSRVQRSGWAYAALALAAVGLLVGAALVLGDSAGDPPAQPAVPAEAEAVVTTRVHVTCAVKAEIYVDGRSEGETPMWLVNKPGAAQQIEVRAPGYETAAVTLRFPEAGAPDGTHPVKLKPIEAASFAIRIETDPTGAMVVKEGKRVGDTPHRFDLQSGDEPFEVQLRLSGHTDKVLTVDPAKGAMVYNVSMVKEAPAAPARKHRRRDTSRAGSSGLDSSAAKPAGSAPAPPGKKEPGGSKYETVD